MSEKEETHKTAVKADKVSGVSTKTAEDERISKLYNQMKYRSGEAIGVVAAQSIAEPATQTALRSYHAGGRTKLLTTQGLPRLLEIFDARKIPTTPTMDIYLDEEHNTKEKAKEIAAAIKETKLRQVLSEDFLDLVNLSVELSFDKKQLDDLKISVDETAGLLKKSVKNIEVESKGKTLVINLKKTNFSVKDLQNIRLKARETHIKGIKGVTQAVVERDKNRWVIRTLGSNLKKVLTFEGVDKTKTRSNHIFEIAKVLGIEAARNSIVNELVETLREQGVNTDIRHILVVADAMTNDGDIHAIGRYGLAGRKSSVLAKANFEETVKHLTIASIDGDSDPLNSIIENIIVGKLAPIGTGLVNITTKKGK